MEGDGRSDRQYDRPSELESRWFVRSPQCLLILLGRLGPGERDPAIRIDRPIGMALTDQMCHQALWLKIWTLGRGVVREGVVFKCFANHGDNIVPGTAHGRHDRLASPSWALLQPRIGDGDEMYLRIVGMTPVKFGSESP